MKVRGTWKTVDDKSGCLGLFYRTRTWQKGT